MGRQIYSLLLLTAQPPVQICCPNSGQRVGAAACHANTPTLGPRTLNPPLTGAPHHPHRFYSKLELSDPGTRSGPPSPTAESTAGLASSGAGEGIRTPDPLITNQMLYQLSYASRRKQLIISLRKHNCKGRGKIFPPPRLTLSLGQPREPVPVVTARQSGFRVSLCSDRTTKRSRFETAY